MLEEQLNILRRLRTTGNKSVDEPAQFAGDLTAGVLVGIVAAIIAVVVLFMHPIFSSGSGLFYALKNGLVVGFGTMFLFFCWPIVAAVVFVPLLLLGFLLNTGFKYLYHYIKNIIKHDHAKMACILPNSTETPLLGFMWLMTTVGLAITFITSKPWQHPKQFSKSMLWLGTSTDKLATLCHDKSIAASKEVGLTLADATQNILVLGSSCGKTTRAIHPILMQLLDQDCGGLIFDIEGDLQKAVLEFAKITVSKITIIGVNAKKMNLLAGLTPQVASTFLKSIFMLNSQHHGDQFCLNTATELCRNALSVLSFVPKYYSLQGLYLYLFDPQERREIENKITAVTNNLDKEQARLLRYSSQYQETIFDRLDEKVKAEVNATITRVLAPFNHVALADAFCSEGNENVCMQEVLNGMVYLVNLPLSVWGLGGKVVYAMIKLHFFNVMQQRVTRTEWDQERPVFFICDEFQEIVSTNDGDLSDLNFWDKSIDNKTIGIISAESISSFYAAIGSLDITHALLQNFQQKLCLRTDDLATLNYFNMLIDKIEVVKKPDSNTTPPNQPASSAQLLNSKSVSTSSAENTTFTDKSVLTARLLQTLSSEQALALLSINDRSICDVIDLMAIFL